MCGLFGYFNVALPDREQQEELFRQLGRKAQVRGVDSWGVAFPEKGKVKMLRGLGPVSKWLAKKPAQVRRVARSETVIGHTRAASRGDVSLVNAHPFRVPGWIGAHNGCFQNSSELQLSARHVAKGETDTEEGLAWLASEGLSSESFRALRGWFALTILKDDAEELVIAVDAKTPFAIARVGDGLAWHSLGVALESSLAAVGISVPVEEVKDVILRLPGGAPVELAAASPRVPAKMLFADEETHQLEFGGEA